MPLETKLISGRIPEEDFLPLDIASGETWSFYVCASIPDVRYSRGTSVGELLASDGVLNVLQGAGAADYPPFGNGTAAEGKWEYTFYGPRLFNGNVRYRYGHDCSEAPSASPSTFTRECARAA